MEWSFALNLILSTALIITVFINRKQIDLEQVNTLIDRLTPKVELTPTQLDDIGLEVLKAIRNQLEQSPTDSPQ